MKQRKLGKPSPAIIVAVLALVSALAGTAIAGPSADDSGASKKAKKALKLAKKNKKAIKNIELTPGPAGPPGPATGPAGGDLSGSYPNPSIASGAVGPGAFGTIPAAKVARKGTNQSIPNGIFTPVNFNSEFFDTADIHDESTDNSRLTAPIDGVYYVAASIRWAQNTTEDRRRIRIRKNGLGFRAGNDIDGQVASETVHSVATLEELEAGEYLEVEVDQSSGGPLDVSLAIGTEATMSWVGPPSTG